MVKTCGSGQQRSRTSRLITPIGANWFKNTKASDQPDFCIDYPDCNPAYAEQFSVDISFIGNGKWFDVVNTYEMKFICESVSRE